MYSELISAAVASGGPHAARTSHVKLMRSVKKSSLRLIETFAEKCEDEELLVQQYIPAMADPVLGDYARNVADARCSYSCLLTFVNCPLLSSRLAACTIVSNLGSDKAEGSLLQ